MRFLFRRKERKKSDIWGEDVPDEFRPSGASQQPLFPPSRISAQLLAALPPDVLERIFAFVCPHARDESYETCEGSANEKGCMLCDLRDLAHCAQVSQPWHRSAVKVLYHSVRIDPVHYCKLEAWLAEKRKKTSRFDRNGVPEDSAQARLRLFRRTVRDDPTRIGKLVQFLKTPYMLRESCHVELAQTIAVLPNLHFVDLPEGMFSDEPAYATLRLEVQARCPNIRKMTYVGGAERSFAVLATGRVWPYIQVLELNGLNIDPVTMRTVLGSLRNLRALKISDTHSLSDEVLSSSDGLPTLPPLEELVLKDTPRVTAAGLVAYLAWHETQQSLKVLTLKDTGVLPSGLHDVLTMATSLKTLAIQSQVAEPFPHTSVIRPLGSPSLHTLRYEISGASDTSTYATMTAGYYTYLATSILSGGFPRLRRLFVYDDTFPEQLQGLPAPNAAFADGHSRRSPNSSNPSSPSIRISPTSATSLSPVAPLPLPRRPVSNVPATNRFSSRNPWAAPAAIPTSTTHALEIFTKSDEFGGWSSVGISPIMAASPPSRRPVSSYGLEADVAGEGWGTGTSQVSVVVGTPEDGFKKLRQPQQDAGWPEKSPGLSESWQPQSGGRRKTKKRHDADLW